MASPPLKAEAVTKFVKKYRTKPVLLVTGEKMAKAGRLEILCSPNKVTNLLIFFHLDQSTNTWDLLVLLENEPNPYILETGCLQTP